MAIKSSPNPSLLVRVLGRTRSMLPQAEIMLGKNIVDKVIKDIQNWIIDLSKPRKELGKFAVCHYAQFAKYQIEKRSISDLAPPEGVEVAIFVLEDSHTLEDLVGACRALNEAYPNYIFLDDHKDDQRLSNQNEGRDDDCWPELTKRICKGERGTELNEEEQQHDVSKACHSSTQAFAIGS